jgi:hypothetical protein
LRTGDKWDEDNSYSMYDDPYYKLSDDYQQTSGWKYDD